MAKATVSAVSKEQRNNMKTLGHPPCFKMISEAIYILTLKEGRDAQAGEKAAKKFSEKRVKTKRLSKFKTPEKNPKIKKIKKKRLKPIDEEELGYFEARGFSEADQEV